MSRSEAEADPFRSIREHRESVETLAERDTRLGAAARVILALEAGERLDPADLEAAGLPTTYWVKE